MPDIDIITQYMLQPIGIIHSGLNRREDCPHQGHEGAPDAWLEVYQAFADGLDGITPGCEVLILTWLHKAKRDILHVHPRNNPDNPLRGVFATRSPDRPNPVGLHHVKVIDVASARKLLVSPLEVLNGTPVIDIKPALHRSRDIEQGIR